MQADDVARVLDHHALQAEAEAERRHAVLAGESQGAELALDAAHAEAARNADAVEAREVPLRALGRLALIGGDPLDVDLRVVREAARTERLGDREVGVGQVDVLADEPDRHLVLGVVHDVEELAPARPVDVGGLHVETEGVDDVRVEALVVQHRGDVVDRRNVDRVDDGLLVDVAHECDLALVRLGDRAVAAEHERVGLDADRAERRDGVLRRLGLLLARGAHERHERDVHEEHVLAAELVAHLAGRLDERLRLDVADRAADLGDDDVGLRRLGGLQAHAALDLVGDVRDHLHRVAEVLAAAFLGDDRRVDLAGGDVRRLAQVDVEEPLVVTDVEVGLGAVVGHEDLAVLERVHRARIHVEIGIELLHDDSEAPGCQEIAETRRRESLAQRRNDTTGHEDVLGRVVRNVCARKSSAAFIHHGLIV